MKGGILCVVVDAAVAAVDVVAYVVAAVAEDKINLF